MAVPWSLSSLTNAAFLAPALIAHRRGWGWTAALLLAVAVSSTGYHRALDALAADDQTRGDLTLRARRWRRVDVAFAILFFLRMGGLTGSWAGLGRWRRVGSALVCCACALTCYGYDCRNVSDPVHAAWHLLAALGGTVVVSRSRR